MDDEIKNRPPIFVDCVGRLYPRCDRRLPNKSDPCVPAMSDICFKEQSARLLGAPYDKFIYLSHKPFYGKGMTSVHVPEIELYAVFLEAS